ncbi:MAG: hypothetical protein ISS15_00085 [Alphaproteobacteria bacterium]|nr:hypothetical protein [Alphaproteobacteria bacterium]MBL7096028.1 hypothetical protein [Alphaproteobacteria bacterium]
MRFAVLAFFASILLATGASAAAIQFEGFADVRLVAPSAQHTYLDGGLGKLRYGEDDANLKSGNIVAELRGQQDNWFAQADGRIDTEYGIALDLTEAFIGYAAPSSTNWRWSMRVGAFFPPFSLENENVGWSTFWTVTPSAINSWVGAEVRTIGAEGTLEWRSNDNDVTLIGSLLGFNDSNGVLIAERGWSFDDRISGLFEKERLPDAVAVAAGRTPPVTIHVFREIDNTPGWYLDLSYEIEGKTGFELMRYDNEADPMLTRSWHTTFWEAGFRRQLGNVTILGQAMRGDTIHRASAAAFTATDFQSAYALVGWDLTDWWLAARADVFQTRTRTAAGPSPLSEDGHAFDATVTWLPRNWVRLSAEYLLVEDTRAQRLIEGDAPHQTETQFQFVVRTYF